jgi:hypothetical protein
MTSNNGTDQYIYDVSTVNDSNNISEVNSYYTSAVFPSAAIHLPATAIAVPVYDNNIDVIENTSNRTNQLKAIVSPVIGLAL